MDLETFLKQETTNMLQFEASGEDPNDPDNILLVNEIVKYFLRKYSGINLHQAQRMLELESEGSTDNKLYDLLNNCLFAVDRGINMDTMLDMSTEDLTNRSTWNDSELFKPDNITPDSNTSYQLRKKKENYILEPLVNYVSDKIHYDVTNNEILNSLIPYLGNHSTSWEDLNNSYINKSTVKLEDYPELTFYAVQGFVEEDFIPYFIQELQKRNPGRESLNKSISRIVSN